jgi:polyisoprenoid-binding protein YceI
MNTTTATKTTWKIDPSHSEIQFKVKHMMITSVTGFFESFDATILTNGDSFESADIHFSAKTESINTNSTDRDNHLRSADFFDSANFSELKFVSTHMESGKLHGHLSIKDITHPVSLDVEFGGIGKDPWGNIKAGFTINGKINRKDWNLNWNAALEAGGVLVSDDVRIHCEVQFAKQA